MALSDLFFMGDRVDSREFGLQALTLPKPEKPERRYSEFSVAGRSGKLRISDESYEEIDKTATFMCASEDVEAATEWLSSITEICTSAEPRRVYTVTACPGIKTTTKTAGLFEFSVSFKCFPLAKDYEEQAISLTSGQVIVNPSSEPAYPSFEITGSGTIVLTIGTQTVTITAVSTSVTVEGGETFACYDAGGSALNRMTLSPASDVGFPAIGGKESIAISFTGASAVTMRPNWRYR